MAFGGSLVYLVTVVAGLGGSADEVDAEIPRDTGLPATTPTPGSEDGAVTYEGPAPERFLGLGLVPAEQGEEPDLRFGGVSGVALDAAYLVPVADLWVGVDALSAEQLRGLLEGTITDWSAVGGQPGPVRFVGLDDAAANAAITVFAPLADRADSYANPDEVLDAVSPGSGAIALVPLDHLAVSASAIAIDGIDLARGRGDPSAWPLIARVNAEGLTRAGQSALEHLRALPLSAPAVTTVVVTGDYLPVRCSLARIEAIGDWTAPFQTTLGDYVRAADLTLSSQDGSVQDLYEPLRCVDTVNLTSPPGAIEGLLALGVDGVTVATNHIFDCGLGGFCGTSAFERTLELLHQAGIKTSGGGLTLEEALAPALFDVNGLRVGVLSFDDIAAGNPSFLAATETSPGTAPMDDSYDDEYAWNPGAAAFYAPAEMLGVERMTERIRAVAAEVDFLIVMFNSGTEDTHIPSERSVKGLRAAAAAGADLVIGNQAHHVQAAEVHNGIFIAYALGNFVYDQVHTPEHTQGYLVEASFWADRVAATRLVPYQIYEYYRPELADGELRTKILGDVWSAATALAD